MVLTKNERSLLLYLWRHVDEEYSINQLAKNVSVSARGAYKILQKFEQQSILVKRQVANAVIHSLNFDDHRTEDLIKFALKGEPMGGTMAAISKGLHELKKFSSAALIARPVQPLKKIDVLLLDKRQGVLGVMKECEQRIGRKMTLHDEGELLSFIKKGAVLWGHDVVYARIRDTQSASVEENGALAPDDTQLKSSFEDLSVGGDAYGTRYLALIENMKDFIFTLDIGGRFTFVNRMSLELLKFEPEELLGKSILEITSENSRPLVRDYLSKTAAAVEASAAASLVIAIEIELRTKQFQVITFSVGLSVQKKSGKVVGINGIARDITSQLMLQREKEEAQAAIRVYLESVLAMVPSGVMVFDYAMYCTYANQKYFELFKEKDVIGKGLHMLLPVLIVQQYNLDMKARQVMQTKKPFTLPAIEYGDKFLRLSIVSVKQQEMLQGVTDVGGTAEVASSRIAIVIIIDDITQLMTVEEAKRRAEMQKREILKLREVDELKTGFLNVTSHELKTPLTPVLIQAQLLGEGGLGKLTEQQRQSTEIIVRNLKQLEKLIDDVLDISRIQSRSLKLEPSEGRLDTLVMEVVNGLKLKVGSRNIFLIGKISQLPPISFDDGRIRQVVRNLIGNALKFTPPGGTITVTARKVKDYLQVDVMDNGAGISDENQKKIFQPFFQVKLSYKIKEKGRGLGLAITKGIIENHGGKIWLDSKLGKGTTFHFMLPIKRSEKIQSILPREFAQAHLNKKKD